MLVLEQRGTAPGVLLEPVYVVVAEIRPLLRVHVSLPWLPEMQRGRAAESAQLGEGTCKIHTVQ